jgi:hypothetical protein
MNEQVGWGRTKNTGLNEAFFPQRTVAAGQVCNFSDARRFYVKGQVSRTRQRASGWKTVALLSGALLWFALLFEGITTVLKAKNG